MNECKHYKFQLCQVYLVSSHKSCSLFNLRSRSILVLIQMEQSVTWQSVTYLSHKCPFTCSCKQTFTVNKWELIEHSPVPFPFPDFDEPTNAPAPGTPSAAPATGKPGTDPSSHEGEFTRPFAVNEWESDPFKS